MSNYIKGNLEIKGTKENVKKFLLEGLKDIEIIKDDNHEFIIEPKNNCFFMKNIKGMIDQDVIKANINSWKNNEENIITLFFRRRNYLDANELQEISDKYNLDLKIKAREYLACFKQEIDIEKGEIIKNIAYDWDRRPHLKYDEFKVLGVDDYGITWIEPLFYQE